MKKLLMLGLVALLSFGVASVSWAQDAAGGQAASATPKSGKKHKSKKKKKSKKSNTEAPAAAPQ